jgi:hypothetical protein
VTLRTVREWSPWPRRAGVLVAAATLIAAPVVMAESTAPDKAVPTLRALSAAAAWRDSLEAVRVPQLPPPGQTESVIVVLKTPPAAAAPPDGRAAAAQAVTEAQQRIEPVLAGLGATVHFRYRVLLDGLAVELPVGRLPAVAALPEVQSVTPVTYLAPAAIGPGSGTAPVPSGAYAPTPAPQSTAPMHIALVDAGVDATHPWLGGGIGPTYPIVGGFDLVDGDGDPTAGTDTAAEAHGTEMAALVLRSPALEGLPPERVPRMVAMRVVAPEMVDGRTRPLARTDRVLAALERAVDPNGDGDTSDRADVTLLGLARGFDGGGEDPLARALKAADRVGSVVVVPSGNDGPSFGPAGTVGGPAAAPAVLSVGGMVGATTPRTADLRVLVGPAAGALEPLPLMGADPTGQAAPVVFVTGADGLASGNDPADYRDASGASRVQGAIAVVGRGGGPLAEKARVAAAAGAIGVAVWDQSGDGAFPGTQGGAEWPIPLVGLGPRQGAALAQVLAAQPGLQAALTPRPVGPQAPAIASFSSRGPTADGRLKPDLVAPAVDLLTAYPGRGPSGEALTTHLSGTSGAAAEVAAMALRLRIDHPDLRPADVRSLLIQSAQPVPGANLVDEGAGQVGDPGDPPVAVDAPIISAPRPSDGAVEIAFALHDLTGQDARYKLQLEYPGGRIDSLGPPVTVAAGVRAGVRIEIPGGAKALTARLIVRPAAGGAPVATAPVYLSPAAPTPQDALGQPEVRVSSGLAEARVLVGRLARDGGRLQSAPLHDVNLWLVPQGGGAPLRLSSAKQPGDWPAGTYRFLLSRRLANGSDIPAGRWRLRVTATGPDGTPLRTDSREFSLTPG